jgi:hypothetical protein
MVVLVVVVGIAEVDFVWSDSDDESCYVRVRKENIKVISSLYRISHGVRQSEYNIYFHQQGRSRSDKEMWQQRDSG